jgi:hypothetical protein
MGNPGPSGEAGNGIGDSWLVVGKYLRSLTTDPRPLAKRSHLRPFIRPGVPDRR